MLRYRSIALGVLIAVGLAHGDHNLSIEEYGKLRELERWQFDEAEKQFKAKRWAAATNEYEKFLKLYPDSGAGAFVQYRIGQCHERSKRLKQAIKDYVAVLDYFPDSPEIPYALSSIARCYRDWGEIEKERKTYERLLELHPDHLESAEALWALSKYYLGDGNDLSRAVGFRQQIVGRFEKHRRYREAVDWLFRHYALTECSPEKALAVRCRIRSRAQAEIDLANTYGHHAIHSHGQREPDRCKKFLELCLARLDGFADRFPGKDAARCEKQAAYFLREIGQTTQALERYVRYFAQRPDDDSARVDFGQWLERIGRWEDARTEYGKMSDPAQTNWEVAQSYHRQRKGKEAVDAYQEVIKDDYGRTPAAYFNMGDVYERVLHDHDKAITAFIDSNHNIPENLFRVVDCYRAMKRWDAALQQLKEILFLNRQPARALKGMVLVYEARNGEGDFGRAVKTCQRILSQFPGTPESSWAHQWLEKHGVLDTGGGLKK